MSATWGTLQTCSIMYPSARGPSLRLASVPTGTVLHELREEARTAWPAMRHFPANHNMPLTMKLRLL